MTSGKDRIESSEDAHTERTSRTLFVLISSSVLFALVAVAIFFLFDGDVPVRALVLR